MSKRYDAREAAMMVLKKTEELLKNSKVLEKYEALNSKKAGYSPTMASQEKRAEASDSKLDVEPGKHKGDHRVEHQVAPGNNPKEQKEEDLKGRLDNQLGKSEYAHQEGDESSGIKLSHLSVNNKPGFRVSAHHNGHASWDEHMGSKESAIAHAKEMHAHLKSKMGKAENEIGTDIPVHPRDVGSAKLAKFLEGVKAKKVK